MTAYHDRFLLTLRLLSTPTCGTTTPASLIKGAGLLGNDDEVDSFVKFLVARGDTASLDLLESEGFSLVGYECRYRAIKYDQPNVFAWFLNRPENENLRTCSYMKNTICDACYLGAIDIIRWCHQWLRSCSIPDSELTDVWTRAVYIGAIKVIDWLEEYDIPPPVNTAMFWYTIASGDEMLKRILKCFSIKHIPGAPGEEHHLIIFLRRLREQGEKKYTFCLEWLKSQDIKLITDGYLKKKPNCSIAVDLRKRGY